MYQLEGISDLKLLLSRERLDPDHTDMGNNLKNVGLNYSTAKTSGGTSVPSNRSVSAVGIRKQKPRIRVSELTLNRKTNWTGDACPRHFSKVLTMGTKYSFARGKKSKRNGGKEKIKRNKKKLKTSQSHRRAGTANSTF